MTGILLLVLLATFTPRVIVDGRILDKESGKLCGQDDFRFSNLFQDGMVLQRAPEAATVWGYGTLPDGSSATVSCSSTSETVSSFLIIPTQEEDNIWKLELEPQEGGNVCTIEINIGCGGQISIKEVLFGDVYLCSGQSNMVFQMRQMYNATEEMEYSKGYPNIRFTRVVTESMENPDPSMDIHLTHEWTDPSKDPQNHLQYMSAICFLYARDIYDQIGVPMGLIVSAWGGTRIESWSTKEMLDVCDIQQEEPGCKGPDFQNCNSRLWNKMIDPLRKTTLKGILWYQGEANANGWNRDIYQCSFPALIDGWRSVFSSNSNTNSNAPFGFVQLSTVTYGTTDTAYPLLRWHQTADYGFVPNDIQKNVFMAVAIDTYDQANGVHPHYKQIVGERLSTAGMNVVYGDQTFPTNGPMVSKTEIREGPLLSLTYDQEITYDNAEISGFYYCCTAFSECDKDSTHSNWLEVGKDLVQYDDTADEPNTISIKVGELVACEMEIPHLAYLWRQTPIKKYLGAPIYAKGAFSLPSAPWKTPATELTK